MRILELKTEKTEHSNFSFHMRTSVYKTSLLKEPLFNVKTRSTINKKQLQLRIKSIMNKTFSMYVQSFRSGIHR